MKNRILALVLALALSLSLTACRVAGEEQTPDENVTASPDTPVVTTPEVDPTPDVPVTPSQEGTQQTPAVERASVNFACLSGPTGVGAAKLLSDNEKGETLNAYNVTIAADNSEIAAKLISGELDIACTASNMAATLYNKTKGGVQALCLSTLGVLYIMERTAEGGTATVDHMADLAGRTIYATGQGANPEYVLDYLLSENGVNPDSDVEIVWGTAQEVQAAMAAGQADLCMLPVPAATAVQLGGKSGADYDVTTVLDLTEEWNKLNNGSILTMTTVVVRTAFAKENPEAVEKFLSEYSASIAYVNGNVEEASVLVEQFGIVPKAAVAKLAIPACNLTYIAGDEMREQIQGYYQVLFLANPASIGGGIPDDSFYYGIG